MYNWYEMAPNYLLHTSACTLGGQVTSVATHVYFSWVKNYKFIVKDLGFNPEYKYVSNLMIQIF